MYRDGVNSQEFLKLSNSVVRRNQGFLTWVLLERTIRAKLDAQQPGFRKARSALCRLVLALVIGRR